MQGKRLMMGTWTGGRRRKLKPKVEKIKTLVVTSPLLFTKRDKLNQLVDPFEWSDDCLRQASENWPKVLIFCPVPADLTDPGKKEPPDLAEHVKTLGISNLIVIPYSVTNPTSATRIWKQSIIDVGGVFNPARNPREVVYMNMQRHITAPHLTWAGAEDHKKAKVEIDKEKSFKDLQDIRKKRAEW
jgi:hypothetical protein